MASRKAQKEAARLQRELAVAELKAKQAFRSRMALLAAVVAVAVAAVVIVIVVSSSNGGSTAALTKPGLSSKPIDGAAYSEKAAVSDVSSLLNGIPQSGNIIGSPLAPITITEFGDLVCPTCDDFAVTTEHQLIADDVRTGKVKLVFRADDTASSFANQKQFLAGQVAARAAGLQGKEWDFVMLTYDEQPQTINGDHAEDVAYTSAAYWLSRAQQL
ncbi:MAG TPA: thioredoxin domain-containing protein, partial [Solirubrobacteraceae bacterium]|nr:thioredoxin domain-containing protein [Solirubrobacteraceae bacterium]